MRIHVHTNIAQHIRVTRILLSGLKGLTLQTPVPTIIVFYIFLLAYCISAFKHDKEKVISISKNLKIVDLHFVKSE